MSLCPTTFTTFFSARFFEPATHIIRNSIETSLCTGFFACQPAIDIFSIVKLALTVVIAKLVNCALAFFITKQAILAGLFLRHRQSPEQRKNYIIPRARVKGVFGSCPFRRAAVVERASPDALLLVFRRAACSKYNRRMTYGVVNL